MTPGFVEKTIENGSAAHTNHEETFRQGDLDKLDLRKILLVQLADIQRWTPITGVDISVDRPASAGATSPMVYPNGDRAVTWT